MNVGILSCGTCGKTFKPEDPVGWRVFVHGKLQQFTCPECVIRNRREDKG